MSIQEQLEKEQMNIVTLIRQLFIKATEAGNAAERNHSRNTLNRLKRNLIDAEEYELCNAMLVFEKEHDLPIAHELIEA